MVSSALSAPKPSWPGLCWGCTKQPDIEAKSLLCVRSVATGHPVETACRCTSKPFTGSVLHTRDMNCTSRKSYQLIITNGVCPASQEMSDPLCATCVAMRSPRRTTSTCICGSTAAKDLTSVTCVERPSGLRVGNVETLGWYHCKESNIKVLKFKPNIRLKVDRFDPGFDLPYAPQLMCSTLVFLHVFFSVTLLNNSSSAFVETLNGHYSQLGLSRVGWKTCRTCDQWMSDWYIEPATGLENLCSDTRMPEFWTWMPETHICLRLQRSLVVEGRSN